MYDLNRELKQGDFEVMFFVMAEQMKKDMEKYQRKIDFFHMLNERLHNINACNDLTDEQFDKWVTTYDKLETRIINACDSYEYLERYIQQAKYLSIDITALYSEIRPEW